MFPVKSYIVMDSVMSPNVSSTHSMKLVPLNVDPDLTVPQHHPPPSLPSDAAGLRILSSELAPCLTLPASSQQICLAPLPTTTLTTAAAPHQICLTSLAAAASTSSSTTSTPHQQQICLTALPATTSSLAQQICLTNLPTITSQPQPQQICLTALPAASTGPLACLQGVATIPPVTSHIACITATHVTSLPASSQNSSIVR
jgi:hypothetical protein